MFLWVTVPDCCTLPERAREDARRWDGAPTHTRDFTLHILYTPEYRYIDADVHLICNTNATITFGQVGLDGSCHVPVEPDPLPPIRSPAGTVLPEHDDRAARHHIPVDADLVYADASIWKEAHLHHGVDHVDPVNADILLAAQQHGGPVYVRELPHSSLGETIETVGTRGAV